MTLLADNPSKVRSVQSVTRSGLPAGRWIEVMPHLNPVQGGLSAVVPQLAAELAHRHTLRTELAVFEAANDLSAGCEQVPKLTHWPSGRFAWMQSRRLRASFREFLSRANGAHIHGLWSTHATIAARSSRALGKPYIVSAHGMLEPWALAQKRWKKRIYGALVERATLNHATCLHALTLSEAEDYRRFGCRAPIAVIPNAVSLPAVIDHDMFLQAYPALRGKRIILFLGRLHPKKGVDVLLKAWTAFAGQFPDTVLVLAGPDTEGTQAALEAVAAENGIADRVVFTGMLDAPMKWSALSSAACFVLPSHSEGLSVAVLEALSMGVPVIVSSACNMPEVRLAAAGWEVTPDIAALSLALKSFLSSSASDLAAMGSQGKSLVEEKFTWPVVAKQMAELYGWVQGGPKPTSFDLQEVPA